MAGERVLEAECNKLAHDLNRLQGYFDEFNQLKMMVGERIASNPHALKAEEQLFYESLSRMDKEAKSDLKRMAALFKQLESQLKQLSSQMRNGQQ